MADFTKYDDVIDSRDIIARLDELRDERKALVEAVSDADEEQAVIVAEHVLSDWDDENGAELTLLEAVNKEGEDYAPDWGHGETLIRDSYFETYAQELAEETGAVDLKDSWPKNHIDWERAAANLLMDYSPIDFDGVTYWVRS